MLSITADYALRAVLVLANEFGRRTMRADEIAGAIGAPANYMGKTLNTLAKAGIVSSSRGRAGGFALAVAPATLPIAHIIDLFEDRKPQSRCLLGTMPCDPARPCAAHARWSHITRAHRTSLSGTTIADLLTPADSLSLS